MGAKSDNYIPTLDGIRAVAITLVILSHESTATLGALGRPGVLLFFALSGYLITYRLLQEYRRDGRISLRNFYIRRVFRILPPATVYLAVVAIAGAAGTAAICSALFFYNNYATNLGDTGFRVGHFWSLSVEEHFYLFWPALLLGFGVLRGWRTAALLAIGICVWRILDNRHQWVAHLFDSAFLMANPKRTDLVADSLLWGCCLAFIPRGRVLPRGVANAMGAAAVLLLIGLGVIWGMQVPHAFFLLDLLPAVALGCVVFAPESLVGRFLELAPMRFIGRLSYSLYIWQKLFVETMNPLLVFLAIFACAYVSYRWVEQPCIRFGRRWTEQRVIRAPAAASPTEESA